MKKFLKIFWFTVIIIYTYSSTSNFVKSDICTPHDPNGQNPDTLCIKHFHQNFGSQFQQLGVGSSAYYGKSTNLRYPGKRIIRKPLDSDFFTSVSAGDKSNGILIKTNKGNVYSFQSN